MAQLFLFSFCGIALQFFPPNFLGKMRAANFFRDCVWVEETSSQVSVRRRRRRRRRGYCVLARKCQSRRKKKKMEISFPPLSLYGLRKGNKRNENKEEKKKRFFSRLLLWTKMHAAHGNRKEEKKENSFLKIGTPALEIGGRDYKTRVKTTQTKDGKLPVSFAVNGLD